MAQVYVRGGNTCRFSIEKEVELIGKLQNQSIESVRNACEKLGIIWEHSQSQIVLISLIVLHFKNGNSLVQVKNQKKGVENPYKQTLGTKKGTNKINCNSNVKSNPSYNRNTKNDQTIVNKKLNNNINNVNNNNNIKCTLSSPHNSLSYSNSNNINGTMSSYNKNNNREINLEELKQMAYGKGISFSGTISKEGLMRKLGMSPENPNYNSSRGIKTSSNQEQNIRNYTDKISFEQLKQKAYARGVPFDSTISKLELMKLIVQHQEKQNQEALARRTRPSYFNNL